MTRLALALAFACALTAGAPAAMAQACTLPRGFEQAPTEVVNATNQFRGNQGRSGLAYSRQLAEAAQSHACYMARTGNFSHTGARGSGIGDRASAAGYSWGFVAENIAFGQMAPGEAFAGWRSSPGHRDNMLAGDATEIGIGVAADRSGGLYWVMVLGRPL